MSRKSWIEESFYKRECVKFIPSSRDLHRCIPVCQVCQNLIRCCCGRLMGEHSWQDSAPPISLYPDPGQDLEEEWSTELHTKASLTNAYGVIDFEDTATRVCRAKYVRVAVDSKPELLLQLMLREWQMDRPKLLLTVQGGSGNFTLPPKVKQAFSKGLLTAALSTGAWILTDGINTGVSKYVGEAVKTFGGHDLRKRNTVGLTPWGVIENNVELIGKDVFRPYQPLGNPLSKRACLNGFHSHFLLVDDGTLGKHGCQQGLRKRLERHIRLQKIHPRLNQGVPVVCVVVEGGPAIVSTVLEYVSSAPPVPVFVLEGSGRAADLIAFVHKQTAMGRQLDSDIRDNFLIRIEVVFGLGRAEASQMYNLLLQCMDHRQSITIFDSESDDHLTPDAAILTTALKGTKATPAEQLSMALAWDRADIAQKEILVAGQHWQVGSLEQALLDALVMDRVSFVKLLIDNGMTMSRFLTVDRLEELYNALQGQTDRFLHHLIEDVKQTSLPRSYRLSIIDVGLVIENLIGGAYRSTYTRKQFRTAYSRLQENETRREGATSFSKRRQGLIQNSMRGRSLQDQHFFRMAQPHKPKDQGFPSTSSREISTNCSLAEVPLPVSFNFNDLFVWAVLYQRQQMALFLWQHGEEALARAIVACKLYRTMAFKARQSSLDDDIPERFKTYSIEFGQLAVDVLDSAFRQNEQMAMKLLTSEMEAWSHFTCLQMAVSSCHRPFVSHSCTQTLLTDLWTGPLNMRKNSFLKIILSLLVPPAILLLEFKSRAEMCHVPQTHETMLFGLDSVKSTGPREENDIMDTEQGHSQQNKYLGSVSEPLSLMTSRFLSWIPRLYEFYTAPVVKFWFHTMSYLGFLMLFSYVTLVKMEDKPSVQEWLVIAYILSTAVEKTREILMSEPRKLSHKLKIWFSEYWNISDFIGILLFLAGLSMRWYADPYRRAGRICYCLDIIFWFVRLLDLLAVNQHAGPYLTMITKMTRNMFFIVVMMAIVLLSFGVSRKAILSPSEETSWSLARDVVFQPYWMIYGEVYAGEIDVCDKGNQCPPAAFLTPFLQAVYLFFQYIIMVNILIAFFNNIYFDMASTSNKIWKYNRYRYIMTYQDRPWLPPPLIVLSHMTLALRATYRRFSGGDEQEETGSGLKLLLGHEDHKKLHEFEEKCVESYIHDKNEGLDSSQVSMIRATAERAEDMSTIVGEVTEKVDFIQDSLSVLDSQLGQLQDLSALAVDTLTLLSATDSIYQEEARLAHCTPAALSRHALPHSWTLPPRGEGLSLRRTVAKSCKSTPPSLLKGSTLVSSRLRSQERSITAGGNREAGPEQTLDGEAAEETPCETCGPSCSAYPSFLRGMESSHQKPWTCNAYLYTSQEETSMEEEEEKEEEEERKVEDLSSSGVSRASSDADLLPEPQNVLGGLVNPSFTGEDSPTGFRSIPSSQWRRPAESHKAACPFRDGPYSYCRSLSSSVENMTFSGAPPSQTAGSVSEPASEARDERGTKSGNSCLQSNKKREWSKSSDFTQFKSKDKFQSKKTVKIKETDKVTGTMHSHMSDASWRRGHIMRGEPRCWSASTSLNQLNFETLDLVQKQLSSHQDVWSPTHSAWSSWARPMSCRSSMQSGIAAEAKTSFQSTENLYPHYSAVERNNLMRLANTIPFTPVSSLGGEEVSIYSLEEVPSDAGPETVSSWSSRGLTALLQPLSSEEGSLDGGLRQGCRVLCTWAEQEVLTPGLVYVVKAFRAEVVEAWQMYFHGSTALQLCIRDIQQQRAAQKMMRVFNQVKPDDMLHSPRFLDVSLVLWHSNGQWLTIERNMCGHFRKYNNNTGEEITPCCTLEEMLLAFSHWTYEYSCRELLVLDMQGVGEELTDPTVVMADDKSGSRGEILFGPDNLGDVAINGFLQKHFCSPSCRRLGLSSLKDPH